MSDVVAAGEAPASSLAEQSLGIADPDTACIEFEPAYELDVVLITPRDHPLAKRRRLAGSDLAGYPLVNAPPGLLDPRIGITLEMLGAFRTGPRRVEASFAAAIRPYVEVGFGIGLIARLPSQEPAPRLHERSMSHEFGRLRMHLVWKKGVLHSPPARAFADLVKQLDGRPTSGRRRTRALPS